MTELTDLLANPPAPRRNSCRFGSWLESLPSNELVAVVEAMGNPDWSSVKLTAVLRKFGMTSDDRSVRMHRKRECAVCGPS